MADISGDSSDDECFPQAGFVSYRERPEWADVTPVPQDDGEHGVVLIDYSDRFRDTYDYFRAVLKSGEISERALELTKDCILFNPSNYTVWYYRRLLYDELGKDLTSELDFIEKTIIQNQKNYQVWEHYKYVLIKLKEQVDEAKLKEFDMEKLTLRAKTFMRKVLQGFNSDSKNYHCWQELHWLVKAWNQWEGEMAFAESLIDDDIRNNSAWNYRFFIIQHTVGFTDQQVITEANYSLEKILLAPNNESAWNYLQGVLAKSHKPIAAYPNLIEAAEKLSETVEKPMSPFCLAFLLLHYQQELRSLKEKGLTMSDGQFKKLFKTSIFTCDQLANLVDTLRANYWNYCADRIRNEFDTPAC